MPEWSPMVTRRPHQSPKSSSSPRLSTFTTASKCLHVIGDSQFESRPPCRGNQRLTTWFWSPYWIHQHRGRSHTPLPIQFNDSLISKVVLPTTDRETVHCSILGSRWNHTPYPGSNPDVTYLGRQPSLHRRDGCLARRQHLNRRERLPSWVGELPIPYYAFLVLHVPSTGLRTTYRHDVESFTGARYDKR